MKEIVYVVLVTALAIGLTTAFSVDIRAEVERTERIEDHVSTLPIQNALLAHRNSNNEGTSR
jgi:hypothetical protein